MLQGLTTLGYQFFDGQYDQFKQKRNKGVFKFGEQFVDYVNGRKELFRRS